MKCPNCGKENNDNWPDNLCQECWESKIDFDWWHMVAYVEKLKSEGFIK